MQIETVQVVSEHHFRVVSYVTLICEGERTAVFIVDNHLAIVKSRRLKLEMRERLDVHLKLASNQLVPNKQIRRGNS